MELLCGSVLLGAIFLASDYSAAPITTTGKVVYGLGCGLLIFLFRWYGFTAEGVPFALFLMSLLSRALDHFTRPPAFGELKAKAREKAANKEESVPIQEEKAEP